MEYFVANSVFYCSHLWMLAIYSILFGLVSQALNKGITTEEWFALNKGLLQHKFVCLAQGPTAMGKASAKLKRPAGVLQKAFKEKKGQEEKEEEKAAQKAKPKLKRPSAKGEGPGEDGESMSLEDKIALFQKKGNQDMGKWLDTLTKGQREALWQRFSSARSSLKDPEAEKQWGEVAKGKGSMPSKLKLLEAFVKGGMQLKNNQYYQQELVSLTVKSGTQDEEEWVPFYKILKRFGLAEAMRRVKKKTILTRRDPKDPSEWQFQMVKSKTYHVEEQGHTKQAKSEGKMDVAEWMKLKGHGMLGGGEDDEASQALADVTGKAQGSKGHKQQLALQDKPSSSEDEPSLEAPKSKKTKKEEQEDGEAAMAEEVSAIEKAAEKSTRVEMMKKLLVKVGKNAPKEVKKDLDKHLESLKTMKPKESMEAVKTKLIACAQAVKKAKKEMKNKK